jgi:hypothetical protein
MRLSGSGPHNWCLVEDTIIGLLVRDAVRGATTPDGGNGVRIRLANYPLVGMVGPLE